MIVTTEKPKLIVDCDGVLLDPLRGFTRWALHAFPSLDLVSIFKNKALFKSLITEFLISEHFSNIPPKPMAVDSISFLSKHFNIDVITSCGNSNTIRNSRFENLDKIFGLDNFNGVYVLPYLSQKRDIFSKYEKGTIVIDDELLNVFDAISCGHNAYWMKYHQKLFKILFHNKTKIESKDNTKIHTVNWDTIVKSISENIHQ